MKDKYKKLHDIINLVKNKNFRNNQNYVLNKKLKEKIIKYAYFSNKGNYSMYSYIDNKVLKHKLFINELAYVKNDFNFKMNLKSLMIVYFILVSFLAPILLIFNGLIITETINGVSRETYLDNLTLLERLYEVKIFFLPAIFLFIFYLGYNFYRKQFLRNHLVFKLFPENKFYIYRYK